MVWPLPAPHDSPPDATPLVELVKSRAQAIVMLQPSMCTLQGRFADLDRQLVTLALYAEPPPLADDAVACVHVAEHRSLAFLAPVVTHWTHEGVPHLAVQRPSQIARMDQRRAFRVPVPDGTVPATLAFGTHQASGFIADLSSFGAQVVLLSTTTVIAVGQRIVLSMAGEGAAVVVKGRVVRRTALGCGVAFTPGPDGSPLPTVVELVRRVERAWLSRQRSISPVKV